MIKPVKRTTIYLHPELLQVIKIKALETSRSVSDLVNEALLHEFKEDQEDLAAFAERAKEPTISYEKMLKELKADGKI